LEPSLRQLQWGLPIGMRGRWALSVATALSLAGCWHGGSPRTAPPVSTTSASATSVTGPPAPPPEGRFLALGGERIADNHLYELTFGPPRMRLLSPVGRVTTLGACPSTVVVAAAQAEVGYSDHLQTFRRGEFGPVDGLGRPRGGQPSLAPDCRVLYLEIVISEDIDRLHLFDPKTGADTVIATASEYGGTSWGPDGAIAFVEETLSRPGARPVAQALVTLSPKGVRRTLPPPVSDPAELLWAASGWMALGRRTGDTTIFFRPETGERHDLVGWAPRAWSPDGNRLLVAAGRFGENDDFEGFRRLGIVELSDLATVKELGDSDVPVFSAVWLPAGSDPLGG